MTPPTPDDVDRRWTPASPGRRRPGVVSVVIPTRNNARTIAACVRSAAVQPETEVVVVDNHSTDGTADAARAAGADTVVIVGPERSAQRNRGFEASTGEYVVFIDSDMVLEEGMSDAVRDAFGAADVSALVLPEVAFGDGYLANCRALEKRLYEGDAAVEAARAFRASDFAVAGGYDERMYGFEDFELADRVVASHGRLSRSRIGVRHDEGRVDLVDVFRKKRYYGSMWWRGRSTLARHRVGRRAVPLPVLRDDLRHVPGLVALKLTDLAGLAWGAATSSRESLDEAGTAGVDRAVEMNGAFCPSTPRR